MLLVVDGGRLLLRRAGALRAVGGGAVRAASRSKWTPSFPPGMAAPAQAPPDAKADREQAYVEAEKAKSQVKALATQVAQLEKDLKEGEERVLVLQGRLGVSEDELVKAQHALRDVEDALSAKERAIAALRDEVAMVNNRVQEKEAHIAALKQGSSRCVIAKLVFDVVFLFSLTLHLLKILRKRARRSRG